MKILMVNSDLAKNRGDRAIAEGIIQLIKAEHPGASILGISEKAERDKGWFGIDFLDMDIHSLNPVDWLRLIYQALQADRIYWGGGELLKDYTNKAALWYWVLKMASLRMVNKNIYGTFQGIGPTKASSSRFLIAWIVKRTKRFIVRDHESYTKLVLWGVPESKLLSSSDPAVLPRPPALSEDNKQALAIKHINQHFLDNFVAIAPRNWFHYKKNGILPSKFEIKSKSPNERNKQYIDQLVELVTASSKTSNVLLLPMHITQDVSFCEEIANRAGCDNVKVLSEDDLSPVLLRQLLGEAKMMIGFRLHSTIIAASQNTLSISYYYVDKGRVFFDQIACSDLAFPIEKTLNKDFISSHLMLMDVMSNQLTARKAVLLNCVNQIRDDIKNVFIKIQ